MADIVLAVEDETSKRTLFPIAEKLTQEFEVHVLFLDELFKSASDKREVSIPREDCSFNHSELSDYSRVSSPIFTSFQSGVRKFLRRMTTDHLSHDIPYEISGFLEKIDPDVFVAAVDTLPFVRSIISAVSNKDVTTISVQHGIYHRSLGRKWIQDRIIPPTIESEHRALETIKRYIFYKYGFAIYCNAYSDMVLTFGDFFTSYIRNLRTGYPYAGRTEIVTTGTPEFNGPVQDYSPNTDSIVFMAQQQLEAGIWSHEEQEALSDILHRLDEQYDLTVRPHPKESKNKVEQYYGQFDISEKSSLEEDVRRHGTVLTVSSTALFEGVIQGRACGVIHVPGHEINFPCFLDNHLLQVHTGSEDLSNQLNGTSEQTKTNYLDEYCYIPEVHKEESSSTKEIAEIISDQVS